MAQVFPNHLCLLPYLAIYFLLIVTVILLVRMINEHLDVRHIRKELLVSFLLCREEYSQLVSGKEQYLFSNLCLKKRWVCVFLLKNWEVCFFFFPVLCGVWWGPDTNIWAVHTTTWIAFALTSDTFTVVHICICIHRYIQVHTGTHMYIYTGTGTHRYTLPLG